MNYDYYQGLLWPNFVVQEYLMIKKNIIQNIANKEMDRIEFLKYSGLVLLSLAGLGTIINAMGQANLLKNDSNNDTTRGFGGGKYGV